MAKLLPLHEDPRWMPFCERYAPAPDRFAIEVLGVEPTPQQLDLYTEVAPSRSRVSVASGHGCFAKGTPIMSSSGDDVPVELVRVGDKLMGPDGNSVRNVLELKHGREEMYRFTYADGTSHTFNESHILCLVATNSKGTRVAGRKTTVTVREWLTWGADKKRCHAIYRSSVEVFNRPQKTLPIPPYILGAWLGDGTAGCAQFTTADDEIHESIADYCADIGCNLVVSVNSENSNRLNLSRRVGTDKQNPMLRALRSLGISKSKRVPDSYLYSSKADRLELLAGLIDTDGHRDKSGYDFVQKDECLARQTAWLARSVGCHATIREVSKRCGNNGKVGQYWRVTIGRNVDQIPVRVERKKFDNLNRQRGNLHFSIKSCEPLGEGDYFGFVLDGDSRFLGGDFTVLHNTGKTTAISAITLWHMLCYPQSITLLTANDMDQLKATLWKEIGLAVEKIRTGPHGWLYPHIEILANASMRIRGFEDTWFVESKTANEKTANKMAGRHGEWLLIIGDEASTLPDTVLTTLRGALTEKHNRMLLTSQPTRNAGFFWRTHHEWARTNGGDWANLTFSSVDSPLVDDAALLDLWNSYDDDERRVRLLGLFPQDSSKHMMSLPEAMRMYGRGRIIEPGEPFGWVVPGDVASGEGLRDKSAILAARVIGYGDRGPNARRVEIVSIPVMTNGIRSNRIAGAAAEVGSDLEGVTYAIDSGGLGVNVCQDLEDIGKVVHRINWGNPCFQNKNKERYMNLRAQAMHQAARAAKDGRLVILTNDHKQTMLSQASRIPKTFTDKARVRVPPKHSSEWEGMASPDLWDAVCFLFLEDLAYIPTKGGGADTVTVADAVQSEVDDLFADVT